MKPALVVAIVHRSDDFTNGHDSVTAAVFIAEDDGINSKQAITAGLHFHLRHSWGKTGTASFATDISPMMKKMAINIDLSLSLSLDKSSL